MTAIRASHSCCGVPLALMTVTVLCMSVHGMLDIRTCAGLSEEGCICSLECFAVACADSPVPPCLCDVLRASQIRWIACRSSSTSCRPFTQQQRRQEASCQRRSSPSTTPHSPAYRPHARSCKGWWLACTAGSTLVSHSSFWQQPQQQCTPLRPSSQQQQAARAQRSREQGRCSLRPRPRQQQRRRPCHASAACCHPLLAAPLL